MKKKFFLRALVFLMVFSCASMAFADSVEINETNFPDKVFRNYVLSKDTDGNGKLDEQETIYVNKITLNHHDSEGDSGKITSLKGIEYFTALESLECQGHDITELDLSKNTNLVELACNLNKLTELDLSKNTKLMYLYCRENKLTKLNLGENTNLYELDCRNFDMVGYSPDEGGSGEGNQLTELDLSKNTGLREIHCENNGLTKLNVSGLVWLSRLYCTGNKLTELDVSTNTGLSTLECDLNKLTELDLSKNIDLLNIKCSTNSLRTLDLSAYGTGIAYDKKGEVSFSGQNVSISRTDLEETEDSEYPYAIKLSAISIDVKEFENGRILSLDASGYSDGERTTLNVKRNGDSLYFSGKASNVTYNYDTKYPSASQEEDKYMFVTVMIPLLESEINPDTPDIPDTPTSPDVPVNPTSPDTPVNPTSPDVHVVSPDTPVVSPDTPVVSPDNGGGSSTVTNTKSETPSSKAVESIAKTEVVEKVVSAIVKIFSNLPDSVKGEIKTLSNTYTGASKTFTSSELAKIISDDEKNPVVLETMTVASDGIYTFKIPESNLTAGVKIFIHMLVDDNVTIGSVKLAEKETESAVFMNDNGDVIDTVPEAKDVNVAAYMQANTNYTPVVTQASDGSNTGSGSGGGCDLSGLGIFGLAVLALMKKHGKK